MHLFALGIFFGHYICHISDRIQGGHIYLIIYISIYMYIHMNLCGWELFFEQWPNPGNPGAWSLNDMYTKLRTPFPPKRKKHLRYWWSVPWILGPTSGGVLIQDSLHQPPLPSTGFRCSGRVVASMGFMEIVCLATQIQPNKNTPKQTTYWAESIESYLGEIEWVVIIEYNIHIYI